MELILQAPIQIKFHIIGALYALIIGPVAIFRNRRYKLLRRFGYSWVVALALTALSSFLSLGFVSGGLLA